MMIDFLEPRRFLSVSFDSKSGTLTVVGTDHVDSIVFSEEILHPSKAQVLRLHFNGQTSDYADGTVKLIRVNAMAGADTVILGSISVPSLIQGGEGNDSLSGGDASDTMDGGGGNDYVYGRKGTDIISGGIGYDTIGGGPGTDRLIPLSDSNGDDTVSGGKGMDTVDYTSSPFKISAFIGGSVSQHAESDKLGHDIEVIIGSVFNDSITNSTSRPMKLVGGAGDDTISGGSGNDTIDGGTGHDSMKGNGGKDVFVSDDGEADTINGGSGADSILSSDSGLDVVTNVP